MQVYEQCVIDNEILGATFRILQGMEVNSETLAVDVIREVGPGGNFLTHEHTFKNFRKVEWFPKLTNREKWSGWEAGGKLSIRERARDEAKKILKEYHPSILPSQLALELDKMAKDAQKRVLSRKDK